MNKQMATKKIIKRKLAKYPMGGETKTPEQIQYEEYLSRNNQTIAGAKAIDQSRENTIKSGQNQLANIDTTNQGINVGIGTMSQMGGAASQVGGIIGMATGVKNLALSALPKTYTTDPTTGQVTEDYKAANTKAIAGGLKPGHEYATESFASGNYGRGITELFGAGTVEGIAKGINPKYGKDFDRVFGKNKDSKTDIANAQKAQQLELEKQQKFGLDKANLASYDLKGREGVEYYNALGGKIKYANYDGVNKGYVKAGGGEIDISNPSPIPVVTPTYSTQQRLKYPIYHQRVVNGQPTYWKGQFEGTSDEWKKVTQNTMPYVPHAEPITLDEYNKNLGTGNMMKTYSTNALGGEINNSDTEDIDIDSMDDEQISGKNKQYFLDRVKEIGIDKATKEYNDFFNDKSLKKKHTIK